MPEDNYENRALFLVMWFGAPGYETEEMFPEWCAKFQKLPAGSINEAMAKSKFATEAYEMRNRK